MNNYDFVDDEFRVANYIKTTSSDETLIYTSDSIRQAEEYVRQSDNIMIIPTNNIDSLEQTWIDFNSMIKHHRRESDWESLRIFGMTNHDHYNRLRSKLLAKDVKEAEKYEKSKIDVVGESYIDNNVAVDTYYRSEGIYYTEEDVEAAISWGEESNRIIITPTRTLEELENLWTDFNSMLLKHRRESDWMSIEIFGINNMRHYEYLKSQFVREDLGKSEKEKFMSIPLSETVTLPGKKKYFKSIMSESPLMCVKTILENSLPNNGIHEELILNNIISDTLGNYEAITSSVPSIEIPHGDMPYLAPEDMVDMGVYGQSPADNYYGALPDNIYINDKVLVSEWFKKYEDISNGYNTGFNEYSSDWVNKVRELMYGLKKIEESGDQKAINSRKQSILELGWYPDIEFSDKARSVARDVAINRISNLSVDTRFIDLKEFRAGEISESVLKEATSRSDLKPVYIVLSSGKSAHSEIIKKLTHSIYSHASVSFDENLEQMYTFGGAGVKNIHNAENKGFIIENIKNIDPEVEISVYTFFVSHKVYDILKDFVQHYKEYIKNTNYSHINLITNFFQIKYDRGRYNMVCSQFVDSFLKSAGINITNKDSSIVSPADLHNSINNTMNNNHNIYEIYCGSIEEYRSNDTKNKIKALLYNAIPLKEQVVSMSEKGLISYLINNINNIIALKEVRSRIGIIKNDNLLNLINKSIYENIYVEAYCDDYAIDRNVERSNRPSMTFISNMITKYLPPIS